MDSATGTILTTDRDPRCPYCGRAVLGLFVQGLEGRYHPECTHGPVPIFQPIPVPTIEPLYPWWEIGRQRWNDVQITCGPRDCAGIRASSYMGEEGTEQLPCSASLAFLVHQ